MALAKVCALQKQYGKTQAELEVLVEGYCWVLADYSMQDILRGLARYVRQSSDIPAPADIVKIIDPPKEPLSAAVYVGLKKRIEHGYYLLSDEKAFLRAYEAQEIAKAGIEIDQKEALAWDSLDRRQQLEYKSNMKVF